MIPEPELCETIEQTILTAPGSISNVLSVLEGVIDSLKTFFGKCMRFETLQISLFGVFVATCTQTESKSFHAKYQTIGVTD